MNPGTLVLVALAAGIVDYFWWRTLRAARLWEAIINGWFLGLSSFVALYVTIHDWRYLPADLVGGSVGLALAWRDNAKEKGLSSEDESP